MKIRKLKLLICAVLLGAFSAGFLSAEIRFKNIFQSDMVLPAGEENIVAGITDPAASAVEVSVLAKSNDGKSAEKKIRAKVNKNGAWFAKIPAFPKRTILEISAKNEKGETAAISNVVTGELWFGSGQSNMEWNFNANTIEPEYREKYRKIADSMKGDVRTFKTSRLLFTEPSDEVGGRWNIISGRNLDRSGSQLGFIFACILSKELDTPVGFVDTSWSGSKIEPWISKKALREANPQIRVEGRIMDWAEYENALNNFEKLRRDYIQNYRKWFEKYPSDEMQSQNRASCPEKPIDEVSIDNLPCKMYNAKVHGLAPLSPKGVLWYQGESNSGEPYQYPALIKLLVTSWRKHFNREFYFYYVDLAAHRDTQTQPAHCGSWGGIRDAMAEVLTLPKTGVATSIDSGGSKKQGQGDIHPPHKELVATRLANLALAEVYKKGSVKAARSPYYSGEYKIEGNKIIVKIANAEGLRKMQGKEKLTGFAVRGDHPRIWEWADAEIKGDTIILSSPKVPDPKAARYAWANWPLVSVESKHGLPLRSFSTDGGAYLDWDQQPPKK
ncbi:MAG: hypothetical protein J6T16_01270 [Opitutales bacterium]|nr:hypothetical protein [Opitutales bacterium]